MISIEKSHLELVSALRKLRTRAGDPSFRKLAGEIGTTSHTTLAELFGGRRIPSWATVADVTQVLGGDPRKVRPLWEAATRTDAQQTEREREEADFVHRYCRFILSHHGLVQISDPRRRETRPLERLYVPPRFHALVAGHPRRISFDQFESRIDRTVVLGAPGSGKSTLGRFLALQYAKAANRVPFFVRLRETSVPLLALRTIERLVEVSLQTPPPEGLVRRLMVDSPTLVIFDGLDELSTITERIDTASAIESFAAEYPNAQVIVTSRAGTYEVASLDPQIFQTYTIAEFDDEQVGQFAERWFEGSEMAAAFQNESRALGDMMLNPLMLTYTCIHYDGMGYIPRNRADLFTSFWEVMTHKWDAARGIDRSGVRSEDSIVVLGELALTMLRNSDSEISAAAFQRLASDTLIKKYDRNAAEKISRELIENLTNQGILIGDEASYGFMHRAFMEYAAAKHIVSRWDTPEEAGRALPPPTDQWRPTIALAAQMADNYWTHGADRLISSLVQATESLDKHQQADVLDFLSSIMETPVLTQPADSVIVNVDAWPVDPAVPPTIVEELRTMRSLLTSGLHRPALAIGWHILENGLQELLADRLLKAFPRSFVPEIEHRFTAFDILLMAEAFGILTEDQISDIKLARSPKPGEPARMARTLHDAVSDLYRNFPDRQERSSS
ncbi:NACHT domain-containing protein [Actinomadura graeca]|uniref:NACHT domain-containing protein n=1 Tax=Actinomadura graeca TaxID=2750812 RepID=A0ABX8R0T3_9ACTN|nr:NACHT domain-containing protein [Actinomadura graeca]QXJ24049.1 NACHT domain-containing protein [Actinomadura graeca]